MKVIYRLQGRRNGSRAENKTGSRRESRDKDDMENRDENKSADGMENKAENKGVDEMENKAENNLDNAQKDSAIKEYLFTALIQLMEQRPYDKITITDIAKKAGVSRMSYYRAFKSKEDILIRYSDKVFAGLLEEISGMDTLTVRQFMLLIFRICQREQELLCALSAAKLYEQVSHYLIDCGFCLAERVFGMDEQDVWTDYWVHRQVGMTLFVLMRWMERGMLETPEKMADFMEAIFVGQ